MNKVKFGKLDKLSYHINEAYKMLRTNLLFCGDDIKVILLTSCTPNEGKTTVSLRLAQSLAEDEKKVVFIDADLRKSVIVGRYGITGEEKIKGLSHYLSGQESFDNVLCETEIDNLDMVLAGPATPNPTELIGNQYFENMVSELKEKYDYVIIDAPPLGSVIDAAIISKVCDGVVYVLENNVISRKVAQEVKKQLDITDCKILGVVLNKVDMNNNRRYRGYYRGYYRKKYTNSYKYNSYSRYEQRGK